MAFDPANPGKVFEGLDEDDVQTLVASRQARLDAQKATYQGEIDGGTDPASLTTLKREIDEREAEIAAGQQILDDFEAVRAATPTVLMPPVVGPTPPVAPPTVPMPPVVGPTPPVAPPTAPTVPMPPVVGPTPPVTPPAPPAPPAAPTAPTVVTPPVAPPTVPMPPTPAPVTVTRAAKVRQYAQDHFAGKPGDEAREILQNIEDRIEELRQNRAAWQDQLDAHAAGTTPLSTDDAKTILENRDRAEQESEFLRDVDAYVRKNHKDLGIVDFNEKSGAGKFVDRARNTWNGLSRRQKIAAVVGTGAVLAVGGQVLKDDPTPTNHLNDNNPVVTQDGNSGTTPRTVDIPSTTAESNGTPRTTDPNTTSSTVEQGDTVDSAVDDIIYCGPDGKTVRVDPGPDGVQSHYSDDDCAYPGKGVQQPTGDDLIIGL